jgi:hypothetical protein
VTPDDLAALQSKYEEMLRLRLAPATLDPRRSMAALASRFPGSLRELPLDALRERLTALAAAGRGAPYAPWIEATHLFHVLTRGALCAKRWLGGRKVIDRATRDAFAREASSLCWGDDALTWKDDLELLAAPPRGRVTELVYERIAAHLGGTALEARILVFGLTRRERAAESR